MGDADAQWHETPTTRRYPLGHPEFSDRNAWSAAWGERTWQSRRSPGGFRYWKVCYGFRYRKRVKERSMATIGRPAIGPEIKTRLHPADVDELGRIAATLGVNRSELIRRYVEDGLRHEPAPITAKNVAQLWDALRGDVTAVLVAELAGVEPVIVVRHERELGPEAEVMVTIEEFVNNRYPVLLPEYLAGSDDNEAYAEFVRRHEDRFRADHFARIARRWGYGARSDVVGNDCRGQWWDAVVARLRAASARGDDGVGEGCGR